MDIQLHRSMHGYKHTYIRTFVRYFGDNLCKVRFILSQYELIKFYFNLNITNS